MASYKIQVQFVLVLLISTLLLSCLIISPFFAPLALAVVFSVSLHPLYNKIIRYTGNSPSLAALLTVFISAICILIPLTFIGTQIVRESAQLYTTLAHGDIRENLLATTLSNIGAIAERIIPGTEYFFTNLSSNIDMYIKQGLAWLLAHVGGAVSSASALLLNLFIFFISLYYLLRDGSKLKQGIINLSPLNDKEDSVVFKRLELAVATVLKGSLLVAMIQGLLTGIGFTLFGVPNSILWGTMTIIVALIPGIGTALVILPAVLYLFIVGNGLAALGLLIWGIVAVGLIDNILGPKLIGEGLELHPLFVLLSVLGGIAFFGPIGIFLGPLTISLLFAFLSTYSYLVNHVTEKTL